MDIKTPRKKRQDYEMDMLAMAAAKLSSEGLSQRRIAKELGCTYVDVNRFLERAKIKGWLRVVAPEFMVPDRDKGLWEQVYARFFAGTDLLSKLQQHEARETPRLKKIWIFHGGQDTHFDRTVMPAIEEIFAQASVVGVTWGRRVAGLVDFLRAHLSAPMRKPPQPKLEFIPLCGEPIKQEEVHLEDSSTALAASLNDIINSDKKKVPPSLRGIPAIIPANFNQDEVKTIQKFMRQFVGYSAIFNHENHKPGKKGQPLYARIDTILTSVGVALAEDRGHFLRERVLLGDLTEDALTELVVGDLGGIIVPKRNLRDSQNEKIARLNDRWTGIKPSFVAKFAGKAANSAMPGVVVLATQPNRRDMVLRCIELGYINQLILSREMAQALEDSFLGRAHD